MTKSRGMVSDVRSAMIVDDDEIFRTLIENHLDECGVEYVFSFNSADEAWEAIVSGESCDLLILDWQLPGLSGLALFNRLRSTPDYNMIPILVASGFLKHEDFTLLDEFPCSRLVEKPFTKNLFKEAFTKLSNESLWYKKNDDVLLKLLQTDKNDYKKLKQKILILLKSVPNSLSFGLLASKFLRKKEAYKEALIIVDKVLEKNKDSIYALGEKAKILHALGRFKESRGILRTTNPISSGNLQRICLLGEVELNLKNPEGARDAFQEVLEIDSEHEVAKSGIVVAESLQEHFVEHDKDSIPLGFASLMNLVAIGKVHSGFFDEAIKQYKSALSFIHTKENINKLCFNLGLGYFRWNKEEESRYWFEQISSDSELAEKSHKYLKNDDASDFNEDDMVSILGDIDSGVSEDELLDEDFGDLGEDGEVQPEGGDLDDLLRDDMKKIA